VILSSLYVLGPVVAFIVGVVIYVVERGPTIGSGWIDFFDKWDDFCTRRRERR
jgi:hypothetical protein